MPSYYSQRDFEIVQNKHVTFNCTLKFNGAVQNLTSCSLRFVAKFQPEDQDAAAVWNKNIGSGITVVSAANGTFTILLSPSDTNSAVNSAFANYVSNYTLYYELQFGDTTPNYKTVMAGRIYASPAICLTQP